MITKQLSYRLMAPHCGQMFENTWVLAFHLGIKNVDQMNRSNFRSGLPAPPEDFKSIVKVQRRPITQVLKAFLVLFCGIHAFPPKAVTATNH